MFLPNGPTSVFYHNVPCLLPSLHLGKCHPIYLEEPAPSTGPIAFTCDLKSLSLLKALSSLAMTPVATVMYFSLTMVASMQDQPKGEGRAGVDYVTRESHAAQQWTPTGKSWCGPQESRGEQISATSWRTGMYTVRVVIRKILVWAWIVFSPVSRAQAKGSAPDVASDRLLLVKVACLSPYSLKKEPSP